MGRYAPLASFLAGRDADRWSASFSEIEDLLGFALPSSARQYSAWWANQQTPGHSQAIWQEVGWRTRNLDLRGERVEFERAPQARSSRSKAAIGSDIEAAIALVRELTDLKDRDEIIAAALRDFAEHAAARGLAALGGTMPDFTAPSRRRPELA